jgi:hypothetical protein
LSQLCTRFAFASLQCKFEANWQNVLKILIVGPPAGCC